MALIIVLFTELGENCVEFTKIASTANVEFPWEFEASQINIPGLSMTISFSKLLSPLVSKLDITFLGYVSIMFCSYFQSTFGPGIPLAN